VPSPATAVGETTIGVSSMAPGTTVVPAFAATLTSIRPGGVLDVNTVTRTSCALTLSSETDKTPTATPVVCWSFFPRITSDTVALCGICAKPRTVVIDVISGSLRATTSDASSCGNGSSSEPLQPSPASTTSTTNRISLIPVRMAT